MTTEAKTKHSGSCHCGAIKFEVMLDLSKGGTRCNCTICTKLGSLGMIGKPADLTILEGEHLMASYEWGSRAGRRHFCPHCGVYTFGKGHLEFLGGDYISVNVLALDDVDPATLDVGHFDGRHNNWQAGTRPTPWPIFAPAKAAAV